MTKKRKTDRSIALGVLVAFTLTFLSCAMPFYHDVELGPSFTPKLTSPEPGFAKYVAQFQLLKLPAKIDASDVDFKNLKEVKLKDFERWATRPPQVAVIKGKVLKPRIFAAVDFGGRFGLLHVHKTYDDALGQKTLYFVLTTYSNSSKQKGSSVIGTYRLGESSGPIIDYIFQLYTVDRTEIGKKGRIVIERKLKERRVAGETTTSIFGFYKQIRVAADGTISTKNKSRNVKRDE